MHKHLLSGLCLLVFSASLWGEPQSIKVLSFRDNHAEAVKKRLKTFESLTGIKVTMDLIASNTVATKTLTDQMAGGSYDLYTVDEPFIPRLAPFFIRRDQWPSWDKIPSADVASQQFLTAAVAGTKFRGTSYGMPVSSNVYLYTYRKDLWNDPKEAAAFKQRYGYPLQAPQTTQHLRDMAEFFTRPPQMYGFAPFTKKSEGTTVEAIWILSTFGVRIFDQDLNIIMDQTKAAKAFQFYKDLMAFAPRGAKSWHHSERMAAYRKGKIAQIMTWPSFLQGLEDPKKSLVVGKSAWGLPPQGPGGQAAPVAGTWALAIPKSTKKQAQAAAFASFWASSQFGEELVAYGMNPARPDLLAKPSLVAKNPWFPAILKNFATAVVRPRFPEYHKVSDRISVHFTKMLIGDISPQASVKALYQDLDELVQQVKGQQHSATSRGGSTL